LLEHRIGALAAIVASNVIFTIYHYGAWPVTVPRMLTVFLVGSVLGFMYYASGSLRLVIGVHFLYDALDSLAEGDAVLELTVVRGTEELAMKARFGAPEEVSA
jgi:membrane protease YdiL (CAAX protease family)